VYTDKNYFSIVNFLTALNKIQTLIPRKLFTILLVTFSLLINTQAQHYYKQALNASTADYIFKPNIRSVKLHQQKWELSEAVYRLKSGVNMMLHFDDMDYDSKNYQYAFIHCDENWEPSNISQTDYLEGFFENTIENYDFSYNTDVEYIHYSLEFPNEQIQITKSGNYLLKIYEEYDEENIVLQKRFIVTENLVNIEAAIKFPIAGNLVKKGQEIDIKLHTGSLDIPDPRNQLKVVILQNSDWNKSITDLKPSFILPGEISYDYYTENVFPGGKEYRYFEFKDLDFLSEKLRVIDRFDGHYQIELYPEEDRQFKPYFYKQDFNGKYVIKAEDYENSTLEAEYAFVHFTIPANKPIAGHRVYLHGEMTNYQLSPQYEFKYNFEDTAYYLTSMLKQGYYNYQIAVQNLQTKEISFDYFDGSNSQTENQYSVIIYFSDYSTNYTRIIGYGSFNSYGKLK